MREQPRRSAFTVAGLERDKREGRIRRRHQPDSPFPASRRLEPGLLLQRASQEQLQLPSTRRPQQHSQRRKAPARAAAAAASPAALPRGAWHSPLAPGSCFFLRRQKHEIVCSGKKEECSSHKCSEYLLGAALRSHSDALAAPEPVARAPDRLRGARVRSRCRSEHGASCAHRQASRQPLELMRGPSSLLSRFTGTPASGPFIENRAEALSCDVRARPPRSSVFSWCPHLPLCLHVRPLFSTAWQRHPLPSTASARHLVSRKVRQQRWEQVISPESVRQTSRLRWVAKSGPEAGQHRSSLPSEEM